MIDIEGFLRRTGMKQRELAERIGVSAGMVTALKNGRSETTYSVCRRLLLAGMTVGELFGTEVEEALERGSGSSVCRFSDEECRKIVERGLSSMAPSGGTN